MDRALASTGSAGRFSQDQHARQGQESDTHVGHEVLMAEKVKVSRPQARERVRDAGTHNDQVEEDGVDDFVRHVCEH